MECCTIFGKRGKDIDNPLCAAILIPEDDEIYVKQGIECLEFDRAGTTIDFGCTNNNEPANPVSHKFLSFGNLFLRGILDSTMM